MKSRVRRIASLCALLALLGAPLVHAQESSSEDQDAVPLSQLIAGTAKKSGKRFVVDPRIKAQVRLVGLDPDRLDYPTLLSVLQVHGFAAVDDGKYVRIVPDANARQLAIPMLTGNASFADAEYVTRIITVKSVPAPMLVPILRPLLPQQAHLVALPCKNTLLLVDSFANVKRIEQVVATLDTGESYIPEKCRGPVTAKAE